MNRHFGIERGFTLIELMVTIAVLAVVAVFALPQLNQFIISSRINSASDELDASLRSARDYAIRTQKNVYLCPSEDSIDCSSDNNWNKGWIGFIDLNGDGALTPASAQPFAALPYPAGTTDLLIGGSQNIREQLNITMSGLGGASSSAKIVRFYPNGEGHAYSSGDSFYTAAPAGTLAFRTDSVQFTICDAGGNSQHSRMIRISSIGKPESGPLPDGGTCP